MTHQEEEQIKRWHRDLPREAPLRFLWTEDPRSREIAQFCEGLERLVPMVQVEREEGDPKGISFMYWVRLRRIILGSRSEEILDT